MIKHIVVFKFKNEAEARSKAENVELCVSMLKALPGKIDVIRAFEVGKNLLSRQSDYDVVLVSAFESLEDLESYRIHPEHQKVVEFINVVGEKRAAVDYEV